MLTEKEIMIECLEDAIDIGSKYFAVKVQNENCDGYEIIVNSRKNFAYKKGYYESAYNDNLVLKSYNKIMIVDYMYADDLDSIEHSFKQNERMKQFVGLD